MRFHPPADDQDRRWLLYGLANHAEVFMAQNRRFNSWGSRQLFGFRYRSLHTRDFTWEDWFREVYGRPSLPGELDDARARPDDEYRLSGYQLYELLVGWVRPSRERLLREFPEELRLVELLPFVTEYCSYRLQFVPTVERYLVGQIARPRNVRTTPPLEQMVAAGFGTRYPPALRDSKL